MRHNLEENEKFEVMHYFYNYDSTDDRKGEWIYISRCKDGKAKENIRYHLTCDSIAYMYGKKEKATNEQKLYVYEQLEKAISYATRITLDKMKKRQLLNNIPNFIIVYLFFFLFNEDVLWYNVL